LKGGADIELAAIPFMNGVRDLAERDLFPSGSRRNHAAYRERVDWGGLEEIDQMMLCDAQTSGGLLVAIPPQKAPDFERGVDSARRIGVMRGDGAIRVK
jgi:selenide,water dikinase